MLCNPGTVCRRSSCRTAGACDAVQPFSPVLLVRRSCSLIHRQGAEAAMQPRVPGCCSACPGCCDQPKQCVPSQSAPRARNRVPAAPRPQLACPSMLAPHVYAAQLVRLPLLLPGHARCDRCCPCTTAQPASVLQQRRQALAKGALGLSAHGICAQVDVKQCALQRLAGDGALLRKGGHGG